MEDYLRTQARIYVDLLKGNLAKIAETTNDYETRNHLEFILSNMEFPRLVTHYTGKVFRQKTEREPLVTDYCLSVIEHDYMVFYTCLLDTLKLTPEDKEKVHTMFDKFSYKLWGNILNPPADPTWTKMEALVSEKLLNKKPEVFVPYEDGWRKLSKFEVTWKKLCNWFKNR